MIEVVGHGGAADFFPGNSRKSVEKALELGVDRIEIDVLPAGDGSLVLIHDERIHYFGKKVPVRDLRLAQLREAVDDLLTFDEVIEMTRDRCRLLVDLKSIGYEKSIAATIRQQGITESTIVCSTFARSLRRIRDQAPGVEIGLSTGHISTVMRKNLLVTAASAVLEILGPPPAIGIAKAIDAQHLMLNYRICGRTFVRLAHRTGLKVYPWTVNHPKQIARMVEMGVDGIISNRPDLVQEAIGNS